MATWADRRDAYHSQLRQERRAEAERNALAGILRNAYEPQGTGQPAGLNMQNAIGELLKGGRGDTALNLATMYDQNTLRAKQLAKKPSAIEVYEYYESLKDQNKKADFLNTMRQTYKISDVGSVPNIVQMVPGGKSVPLSSIQKEVSGSSAIAGGKSRAAEIGREMGAQEISLIEMRANLPRLEEVVEQLSGLGEKATYTKSGQAYDFMRKELGFDPRESAISRREYIAKVDNEVLPLLRLTFGAAFTQKEGESLKATLGDPDASPAEKDAVLRSFIDSKRSQVESQERKINQTIVNSPSLRPPFRTGTDNQKTYKIPKGARTGTDETGRRVFSTDGGKTVFDAITGKRVQ